MPSLPASVVIESQLHKGGLTARGHRLQKVPTILQAITLAVLTLVTYIPSMTNGFIWDDPAYVIDNQTLKSGEGFWRIWTELHATPQYYPMVHTTFWIEARMWGTDSAPGYHVDNILLHALASVLLWLALLAIDIPWAWLAAAIFAVHPVMVESVAWITERKNVLSIVFYLLAFHSYLRSKLFDSDRAPDVHPGLLRQPWYLASLLLFLLALLSKTVTCSLPAALLLLTWWKRGTIRKRDITPLLPMFALGLFFAAITSHLESSHVGASGPDFQWSPLDRCLIAGHAICFYAVKLIWPHPLMFMYPHWDLHSDRTLQVIYPAIVLAIVSGLWICGKFIGRGPLVGVLFFIGTLTPALGFVNVYPMRYSFVADHFQYLASIGIIVLITVGLSHLKLKAIGVLVFAPLAFLTWRQQHIYKNALTLWENTIQQNETCWMAHVNLASVLQKEKKQSEAIAQSERALQLAPHEADTNYDVGVARAEQGRWVEARDYFKEAIRCDPTCAPAWSYLARVLWEHFDTPQDKADAVFAANNALEVGLYSNLADPHYVLGRAAQYSGDYRTAIAEYAKALTVNGKDFYAHFNNGFCLLQVKRNGDAAGEFKKVLEHTPDDTGALTYMGDACMGLGRRGDAVEYYHKALSIDPGLAAAKVGLERALGAK